jgi:hypothetical protein
MFNFYKIYDKISEWAGERAKENVGKKKNESDMSINLILDRREIE